MKYLFFDIECANSFKNICKMCSFGYVITNENFKIIEKKDILINPESEYDWYLLKKTSKTRLAYPKKFYNLHEPFNILKPKIEKILTNNYEAIFGYAVINDLKYIDDSYGRYDMKKIDLEVYDIKEILKAYNKSKGGLQDNFEKLTKDKYPNLKNHKSDDDALMTMYLLKEMCLDLGVTINEMLELSEVKKIKYEKKTEQKNGFNKKRYRNQENKIKRDYFNTYFDKENLKTKEINNMKFNFDLSYLIKKDIDKAIQVAEYLYDNGGFMTRNQEKVNFLVAKDANDKARLEKIESVNHLQIILLDEVYESEKLK